MKSLFRITLTTVALAAVTMAQAQTSPFASFQQIGGDKSFQFLNTGATSTFVTQDTTTSSTVIPVNFTFLAPNTSGFVNVALPANLVITSVVSNTASFGLTASQPLTNVQISFVGTGPVLGNLLTLANSTGVLGGALGDSTAGLEETDNGGVQIVNFASNYINFNNSTQRNYSIALNNVNAALANGGNGYLQSFQSNASGVFASNGIAPEPSTLALLGIGALGLVVRKRKNPHC